MGIIKCRECGNEFDDVSNVCPVCGCPSESQESMTNQSIIHTSQKNEKNKTNTLNLKNICSILAVVSVACFIVSGVFFSKGNDVKNNYYSSKSFSSFNKNAYVGGDAYNYIINGSYFTGYSVIASAFLISGVILVGNSLYCYVKYKENEQRRNSGIN